MPHLFHTIKAGSTFGVDAKFWYRAPNLSGTPAVTEWKEKSLPAGVIGIGQYPSGAEFNGSGISRWYGVGGWSDNVVFTEQFALLRQGILPPTNDLVNASGTGRKIGVVATGSGALTGTCIFYVNWRDEIHSRQSPLSEGSPSISFSSNDAVFDNLPTAPADGDTSVTHMGFWVSVDGADPALLGIRTVGVTGATFDISALALGEIFSTTFQRFPRCRFNTIYHDRQVMAGDAQYPDRLYLSEIGELEHYGGLFLRTRKGEPITALASVRDHLLVFGARSSYVVQGYTEDDIQMEVLEPEIGCINHLGIRLCHGIAIIPSHQGFYASTGTSMMFLSKTHQEFWAQEYIDHLDQYESDAWGAHDPTTKTYHFYVGSDHSLTKNLATEDGTTDSTKRYTRWILDYTPMLQEVGGTLQDPELSFFVRDRQDSFSAFITEPGRGTGKFVTGSCDGIVRFENDESDTDDDSDTFAKTWFLRTKHYYWDDGPMGPETEGFTYPDFWMHMLSEVATYKIDLYGGDEDVWRASTPSKTISVPAGQKTFTDPNGGTGYLTARSVRFEKPKVSGRGLTVEMTSSNMAQTAAARTGNFTRPFWAGFGGTRTPGENQRLILEPGEEVV